MPCLICFAAEIVESFADALARGVARIYAWLHRRELLAIERDIADITRRVAEMHALRADEVVAGAEALTRAAADIDNPRKAENLP